MPFRTIARLNPAKPKAGEEFRLQDAEGRLIPAKYINLVEVCFEGEKVAEARPGPSTSANPLYAFKFKAEKAGTFTIKLKDTDGDTGEASVKLELA